MRMHEHAAETCVYWAAIVRTALARKITLSKIDLRMSSRSLSGVPNWWRAAELVSYFPVKGSLGGTCLCLAVLLKSAHVYTRTYTLLCVSSRYVRQGHGGGCDNFPWTCLQGRCYVIHGGVCVSGVDDNVSGTCTQWFFDSTFLWLHYSFTLYFFYSTSFTILWLYYSLTLLFLI